MLNQQKVKVNYLLNKVINNKKNQFFIVWNSVQYKLINLLVFRFLFKIKLLLIYSQEKWPKNHLIYQVILIILRFQQCLVTSIKYRRNIFKS